MPSIKGTSNKFSTMRTILFEAFVPRSISKTLSFAIVLHFFDNIRWMFETGRAFNDALRAYRLFTFGFIGVPVNTGRASCITLPKLTKVQRGFSSCLGNKSRIRTNISLTDKWFGEAIKGKEHLLFISTSGHSG